MSVNISSLDNNASTTIYNWFIQMKLDILYSSLFRSTILGMSDNFPNRNRFPGLEYVELNEVHMHFIQSYPYLI